MSQKEAVTVNILDREYRIACEPGERRQLLDAADLLDQQMREVRDGGNIVGVEKVAVLAGLNFANDLLKARAQEQQLADNVTARVKSLREKLETERFE